MGAVVNLASFVFGDGNQMQEGAMEGAGSRDNLEATNFVLRSDPADVMRMTVGYSLVSTHGTGLGDELGQIILATRHQVISQAGNMEIDHIKEYHAYDADNEDSDQEQYLELDSVESSECLLLLSYTHLIIMLCMKRISLKLELQ